MTTLALTLQAARIKVAIWHYRARRAARLATLRAMRRVLDWLDPERQAEERQGQGHRPCPD